MAHIDVRQREIHAKIVYYGPGLSGKTTNLRNIHDRMPENLRGAMKSIETDDERTLFFDFIPVEPVQVGGWSLRFHLYSAPGQEVYVRTRRALLSGADGVVFVADADAHRLGANQDSLTELQDHLGHYQRSASNLPVVLQYNKVDLPSASSSHELDATLNTAGWTAFEAIATRGNGVAETLATITRQVARTL